MTGSVAGCETTTRAHPSQRRRLAVAGLVAGARPSATDAQRAVALAIAPMVAVTIWLAASSDHVQRPVASAFYWSYLVAGPMAIGLYWCLRRPASRFGPLLVAFGAVAWRRPR